MQLAQKCHPKNSFIRVRVILVLGEVYYVCCAQSKRNSCWYKVIRCTADKQHIKAVINIQKKDPTQVHYTLPVEAEWWLEVSANSPPAFETVIEHALLNKVWGSSPPALETVIEHSLLMTQVHYTLKRIYAPMRAYVIIH